MWGAEISDSDSYFFRIRENTSVEGDPNELVEDDTLEEENLDGVEEDVKNIPIYELDEAGVRKLRT